LHLSYLFLTHPRWGSPAWGQKMKIGDFIHLNDSNARGPWFIRPEHISAVFLDKQDKRAKVHLLSGQDLVLSPEESRQLLDQLLPQSLQLEAWA
jgi:hypothetical protein